MAKYQVVIPWAGVARGQTVELASVHPSIAANVRRIEAQGSSEAETAAEVLSAARAEADRMRQSGDAHLADKRAEADRILSDAEGRAQQIVDAARAEADRIVADATTAASKAPDTTGAPLDPATPGATASAGGRKPKAEGDKK